MSPSRWEKVQQIFHSALACPSDGRPAYLFEACAGDTELLREVESLISAGRSASRALEGIREAAASQWAEPEFSGTERFLIRRRLGSGGFGVVYQVYDRSRDSVLALKTLPRNESGPLYRFKQEFRALADISHPNLAALYELLSEQDQWFFTMEFIDGVNFLRYVTPSAGYHRLREALPQLAAAVYQLHENGKLHCDLKPENVLVTAAGRLVVLDFGLVTDASAHEPLAAGTLFGTPAYLSPEQAAGERPSPASDWYSVGAMLYQALTGELPFSGTVTSILRDKQGRDAPAVSRLAPDAPADLAALCSALLSRRPSARPAGADVLRRLGARPEGWRRTDPPGPPLLVGRERELATLDEALRRAGEGHPAAVLISGLPGVGKSALARNFLETVRARQDTVILEGRCYERESVPYKSLDSLVDSLNRYLLHLAPGDCEALLPSGFLALTRLFPVLQQLVLRSGAPAGVLSIRDAVELRRRGFQAMLELLTTLAAQRPLVLLIDDLQWGDTDSAEFLLDLLSSPEPLRILFVACYRGGEAANSPVLKLLLGPSAVGRRIEIPLEELDASTAREFAASLLGAARPDSSALAGQIARESGGNPFYVGELVRHAAMDRRDFAPTLSDLIRLRVARLPDEARRLLEVIALAGQPIDVMVARHAAGLPVDAHREIAHLHQDLLIRTRTTAGAEHVETYHDCIRQSAESTLTPEAVLLCHRRLAVAGETSGRSDPRFLALHFRGAGVTDKAFSYAIQAADQDAAALAFDNAARFYRMALELGYGDDAQCLSLRVKLAAALANAGRGAESAEAYMAAAATAGDGALDLRCRAVGQFLTSGRVEKGLEVTRDVLRVIGMSIARYPWQALLSFVTLRALIRIRGLRFRERPEDEIPADRLLRIDICSSLVQGLGLIDVIRALPFQARLLLLSLRSGEPLRIAKALCLEAGYLATAGDRNREKVEATFRAAGELVDRLQDPNSLGLLALSKGVAAFLQGRWKTAFEQMSAAEIILRERCTGVAWEVATAHTMWSVSLFLMGRMRELQHRLPRIIKDAESRGDLLEATDLRTRLAHVLCLAVDAPQRAHQELDAVVAQWQRKDFDLQHWWAWMGRVEIELYSGAPQAAWERVRLEWPGLRGSLLTQVQYIYLESLHHRARAALAAARPAAGAERRSLLRGAARDARKMEQTGAPWAGALAALLNAGVAAELGAEQRAIELLENAEARLGEVDMQLYAMAARRTRGIHLGGQAGGELVAAADQWMRDQGILNPERLTAMLAPGL